MLGLEKELLNLKVNTFGMTMTKVTVIEIITDIVLIVIAENISFNNIGNAVIA
ncbi:hypothetical protein AGMMS49921_12140 [Endomicrobiia bacterium]|nr:hypothetical protein AGMMS49921_12140 [Endomicrobiia bacterium]